MNHFPEIKKTVDDTFPDYLKEGTLDLLSFFENNSMNIQQLFGYWSNQLYYAVNYKNDSVCYILLHGTGDEKQFAPLTIWTDDSKSEWYTNCQLNDDEKIIAWNNVDYCVNCGSCKGGTGKIIFDKPFDNICRTTMRFTNPDKNTFSVIKKLLSMRLADIKNQLR